MNTTLRNLAINKARQSISSFRISAIGISKNGNVIASAFNRPRFGRSGGGVHAEMELLRRGRNQIATIILCRIGKNEEVLPIEPCIHCRKIIDKLGIKIVYVS